MKTLFYGGKILTMADPLYAEALLVEDDKILAVGSRDALLAQAGDCQQVDLHGAAVLPGFIDPHSHFMRVATSLLEVPMGGADTVEKMKARMDAFVQERNIQPGQWVQGRDYDSNIMPNGKNPTLADLDAIAPQNPLVIHHKSGHMGLMNSLALEKLGVTADTKAPEGGRIETKGGKLTGYLEENAFFQYIQAIPGPDAEVLLQVLKQAQDKYASYGITTVQEGMVVEQILPIYQLLAKAKVMNLDVFLFAAPNAYDAADKALREMNDPHIHLGGVKVLLDGSPQGRTAWMRQPYEGDAEYTGYPTMTDEALTQAFIFAGKHHTQLLGHCNGDAAAEQYLRCLEQAEATVPELAELRPVVIHGQLMGRDQLPRAAKLGAMVSFFVAHVYHWGDVHLKNFGKERADHISAAKSAQNAGVKFTFHQDAPVIEPDMLETIWCAVNRTTKNGVKLGADSEALSTLEALRAVTVNAAYQYFREDSLGTLEAGKQADMVILDKDPLETDPTCLRDLQVLETYKNGKLVYHRS